MSERVFDPSVAAVQEQLALLSETHRLTVVCGLLAPATGEIALVQTIKSAAEEGTRYGLKLPQGGIKPNETIGAAYLREIEEEIGVSPNAIAHIRGVRLNEPLTGGRPRGGKLVKAYGIVCGTLKGNGLLPKLTPLSNEIEHAGWYPIAGAHSAFHAQRLREETHQRGKTSLDIMYALKDAGLLSR